MKTIAIKPTPEGFVVVEYDTETGEAKDVSLPNIIEVAIGHAKRYIVGNLREVQEGKQSKEIKKNVKRTKRVKNNKKQ